MGVAGTVGREAFGLKRKQRLMEDSGGRFLPETRNGTVYSERDEDEVISHLEELIPERLRVKINFCNKIYKIEHLHQQSSVGAIIKQAKKKRTKVNKRIHIVMSAADNNLKGF